MNLRLYDIYDGGELIYADRTASQAAGDIGCSVKLIRRSASRGTLIKKKYKVVWNGKTRACESNARYIYELYEDGKLIASGTERELDEKFFISMNTLSSVYNRHGKLLWKYEVRRHSIQERD